MTDARVEKVYEDVVAAREFVTQAERFLTDASVEGLGAASRVVLLHNAAISACDGILQAVGLRVTPGDGSHIVRLEAALEQIDGDTEELLERLDASRERRNEASYRAGFVGQASVSDAHEATVEVVRIARDFVGE
jgi:hypothetical protein